MGRRVIWKTCGKCLSTFTVLVGLYYCISRLPGYRTVGISGTLSKFLAIAQALV